MGGCAIVDFPAAQEFLADLPGCSFVPRDVNSRGNGVEERVCRVGGYVESAANGYVAADPDCAILSRWTVDTLTDDVTAVARRAVGIVYPVGGDGKV